MNKTIILLCLLLGVIAVSTGIYLHFAPVGAPSILYLLAKSLAITAWVMVALILAKMLIPILFRRGQR